MPDPLRLLIVTAAFGEGHNSAARNLGLAFDMEGIEAKVCDPCMLAGPRATRLISSIYRYITTHFPKLWERIYQSTGECDFRRQRFPLMRKPERYLARLVDEYQPAAVISTYPIYPYFLERHFEKSGKRVPVFTVVTDSLEINAAWSRAPTDHFLVTDSATKDMLVHEGIAADQVADTGFPVHPDFSRLEPVCHTNDCSTFRVLYFPTASKPFIRRHSRAILDASPSSKLTIVLGKNVRLLYKRAREIQLEYPGRVKLIGWTRKVPRLLNSHHLVVGKAGGATVHEAIAARCPMLIHHLVPGQEEGNLRLLEMLGAGGLAESPEQLQGQISKMLENDAQGWRQMKDSLVRHNRNSGAMVGARYILDQLQK
ncbi:hypothetical protein JIN85_04635 [Luteolibacter pohnpeiensis]|uniref:Diacylglycerol glucosyltransferase N-terminal domain-containing protein n=1 Tax=Luteolibacter pohnpeiensis TaxID=454153 RepID=A0A934S3L0_9BACT|nr:hypothetical protein [Luteolibacter pohnpeiensis]MBK1881687.1 hypothetical protein [Luteolibacter pohnpeiensis]